MAEYIKLNPDALTELRTVNPSLISYNIEMTEVTGGTFWKAYTDGQIDGTEQVPPPDLSKAAEAYVLTGNGSMRSRTMILNGRELILGENDALPNLSGEPVSGSLKLAPGTCAFIVL